MLCVCVCVCVGWNIISSSWNWYKWLKMAKIVQNFVWNGMMRESERERWKPDLLSSKEVHHTHFCFVAFNFDSVFGAARTLSPSLIFFLLCPLFQKGCRESERERERDGAYFDSTTCTQWAIQYIGNKIKYWCCTLRQVPNVLRVGRGGEGDIGT